MAFGFFKKKQATTATNGPRYYSLRVKEIIKDTKDAIIVVFEQPEPKIEYKSGQFLTIITSINGKDVRRAYSLCSSGVCF